MPRSLSSPTPREKKLAKAVLTMAAHGNMPDTYWLTDRRIALACQVLDWPPESARTWARAAADTEVETVHTAGRVEP